MDGLSIIIPIYNEEKSIENTIGQIKNTLKDFKPDWEILCINDGSSDNSHEVLSKINGIRYIPHRTNKGYGASLKTGLKNAKYEHICITDADGTYPNDMIPVLYNHLSENSLDMVIGARIGEDVSYPLIKKIPKFFIVKLANYISNSKILDINSGLRIFKLKAAMEFFHLYPNGFSFTTTITMGMLCSDYNVDYVPINYFQREGKSKIHPWKDTIGFFKLLLRIALYFNPFKFFTPIIWIFVLISIYFLSRDVFVLEDLTQGSIFFPIVALIFFTLGLMSDLIIKRRN
jgi:glycosyltransferase involved in cell wall biosynthesis